ncbi:hypothetical protein D3OALGB2SA_3156 [Olavius algarvensis associated proteobacterium Delta 3]|nr:hypothetical protein D3OALGB2SA_3156 [Olavius algarvensis associated proteobacterium Delta 3]
MKISLFPNNGNFETVSHNFFLLPVSRAFKCIFVFSEASKQMLFLPDTLVSAFCAYYVGYAAATE